MPCNLPGVLEKPAESSAFGPGFSDRLLQSLSESRGDVRRFHPGRSGTGAQIRGTPKSVVSQDLAALSSSPQLLTNSYFSRTTTSTRRRHCRLLWLCLSPRTEGCRGASLRFGPPLTPLLHTRPSRWGSTGLVDPRDPPPLFPLLSGLIPPP